MRHGEPEIPAFAEKIRSSEFRACLDMYNRSGLAATSRPGDEVRASFDDIGAVVASDLRRSIESASLFVARPSLVVDPLFREVEDGFIELPLLRLSPRAWGRIFIALWLTGAFGLKASFREGRRRAGVCADRLIELAHRHERVLFVGHGFINMYIARELKARGWSGPRVPSKAYWSYGTYRWGVSK